MEWERNSGSPFGVLAFLSWNHSWNRYHYEDEQDIRRAVKLMSEAGVGFVRMDFYWEYIEPQQGDFRFRYYDTIVRIL
ncbi:MAG: beta-galactosidase, partial [Candidatus Omnitrophica bacterium]|nr:beta-galactosidase [Candidatus Omnitrophota bacterium]